MKMKVNNFIAMLNKALFSKTLYVLGGCGLNGTTPNKLKYCNENNKKRIKEIMAIDNKTYMFDCCCLGKSILWGWNGDTNTKNCGVKYGSNGVKDFSTATMDKFCYDISKDFTPEKMTVGEWLHTKGHCGYYIGVADDGLPYAIECTPQMEKRRSNNLH